MAKISQTNRMSSSVKFHVEFKQLLALFLGIFTILLFYFGEVLLHPNEYLLQHEGDGLKNYFTLIYYLDHDTGTHFSGMNYPYGEHVVYTDNQPALAFLLKIFHQYITPISQYTVGIVNFSIFFSIFVCGLMLYLILRKFSVEPWFAMAFALLITMMSPQINRFIGHFSLSYCMYIPLLWYMLIRFMEKRQVIFQGILIIITITFFSFIHLYYLLIGTLMVLAYTFVWALQRRTNIPKKRLVYLTIISFTPLLFVATFLAMTDTITDRPSDPGGFFHYRAYFNSIFLPPSGPISEFLNSYIVKTTNRFEGQAYVGFIAFFVVFLSVLKFLKKIVVNRFRKFPNPVLAKRVNAWAWAGTLVLLFSTAFPFSLGLEFLLDYIPGLRQFRSLGRFAWVFYYIIGVYAGYVCFLGIRKLRMKGRQGLAVLLTLLILGIWGVEASFFLDAADRPLHKNEYFADGKNEMLDIIEKEGYIIEEFQAILFLPLYQIGSEKTFISRFWNSFNASVKYSHQLGLPLAQGCMSRSSITQALHMVQQVATPLIKKEVLQDLPNKKPYLVIAYADELLADEKKLLQKAKRIAKHKTLTIYELPLSAFNDNHQSIWKTYEQGNLEEYNGILTDKSTKSVIIDELEEPKSGLFFQGKERKTQEGTILELFNGKVPLDPNYSNFEASVWVYADPNFTSFPIFRYERFDEEGNKVVSLEEVGRDNTESAEGWVRFAIPFENKTDEKIKIYLEGEGIAAASFMIRPDKLKVYQELEKHKRLNFNNYFMNKE